MEADRAAALDALRPALLRIARLHLRNDAWAEDAVSETMLAALENRTAFEARSKLKTWLVGILKHKIIDTFRARRRERPLDDDDDDQALEDGIFKEDGHYRDFPQEWSTPESDLSRNQFLEILEICVQELPAAQGRIFLMREWLELSTDEICKELTITTTNAGVLLHRARLRLRECLQLRWFQDAPR
ncbi:MAG: sigma-70 family RNA polymerase sigma factor [Burkholderiaceae bacterium]